FDLNTDRNSRNCELTTDSVNVKGKTPSPPPNPPLFPKKDLFALFLLFSLAWICSDIKAEQIFSLNTAIVKIREKLPLR
ncbi:unnamed protein product, partial [Porites lobata]